MYPKFVIVSHPDRPFIGTFVYGTVCQHKELVKGYVKVHGGGWYDKDDANKTITLYGGSGDYGYPDYSFLNLIPRELQGYKFIHAPGPGLPGEELDLTWVGWV